jgi:hypothetical protein
LPAGGFGNLIALPLQKTPRERGNSVFLDKNFNPFEDQWSYLATISKISTEEVNRIVSEASSKGKILSVRLPIEEDDDKPWDIKPSRIKLEIPTDQKLPQSITIVLSNQLFIAKQELPPGLINKLIRLAAFQNPEFYKAQAMRLSTFGKPRIIGCAENFSQYIGLPRGCLEECVQLLALLNIGIHIDDKRNDGSAVKVKFLGKLTNEQQKSAIVADYGHIIVDECHHLSAVSFESVMRASKAKYVLGLTATAIRKDGHHPIIFMQMWAYTL